MTPASALLSRSTGSLYTNKARMDHARLSTDSILEAFCFSHATLVSSTGVLSSSCSANSAIAVASTWARSGTPYTILFPEFQPPPLQTRSRSMSTPRRIRFSEDSERLQTVYCLMATRLNAVGITQLPVPELHGHPYLSGLKRTLRSAVLNFQRQNQCASCPRSVISQ